MSSARILVADDDPHARNLLGSILREAGFRDIVHAGDGQRALLLLSDAAPFTVAFLDIEMPGYSGLEVLSLAKSRQPDCSWVMVSGNSAVENVLAGLRAGAGGFIVKPYSSNKILDVLTRCRVQFPE